MFIKVAICSAGELFGGVERHILTLGDGLQKLGIQPLTLLFHENELAQQIRTGGLAPWILPNSDRLLWKTSRLIGRILSQNRVSVVHVHGYKASVYCAAARLWYPFSVVKTVHGLPESRFGSGLQWLRDRVYHLLDYASAQACRASVCYVTRELSERHGVAYRTLPSYVIPNGVAASCVEHTDRPQELGRDRFNLVLVGRLDRVKGIGVAIEALATRDVPADIQLLVIGEGPQAAELQDQASALGLGHRVRFLGFRRAAVDYIAHCDALLMPSLHEGLPYTLLEAMAAGRPIAASAVGGLSEVLENEVTALLVPPGDPHALSRAMVRLYFDPRLRERLGVQAKRLAQTKYSEDAMTRSYVDVYHRAIKRHSPTGFL